MSVMTPSRRARARTDPAPPRDTGLLCDAAARAAAADDFGHIVHRTPAAVLRPESEEDIAEIVRWAGAHGAKVAAQGRRHSLWGRSQVGGDGVAVDMSTRQAVHAVERDRVVVDAGATWGQVLAATLPHGATPPVLCEYLDLSVGGTLSVGGVGGTTARRGVQADNVIALRVVTGTGETLTCSPTLRPDLFRAVCAGLGQVAVIVTATLRLVRAASHVRRVLLFYADLAAMLRDARRLAADGRFDALQGAILPAPGGGWAFRLDVGRFFTAAPPDDAALLAGLADDPARRQPATLSYIDDADRLSALEAALRADGRWWLPHPWLATFIGETRVEPVVAEELRRIDPERDLGRFGQIGLTPIRRAALSTPLLRLPAGPLSFAFTVIRFPATAERTRTHRLVRANAAIYDRVRRAGGTLYPASALPVSHAQWRDHFGPAYEELRTAKWRHDPEGVLTPGYTLFA